MQHLCSGYDNVRHGLCGDLGFSEGGRKENIRRIGEVVKLFAEARVITLAFISPFSADRLRASQLLEPGDFVEVYCRCPLEVCGRRDVKGIYQRARAGAIHDFIGISSPYEEPEQPELVVDTGNTPLEQCVAQVIGDLYNRGIIPAPQ